MGAQAGGMLVDADGNPLPRDVLTESGVRLYAMGLAESYVESGQTKGCEAPRFVSFPEALPQATARPEEDFFDPYAHGQVPDFLGSLAAADTAPDPAAQWYPDSPSEMAFLGQEDFDPYLDSQAVDSTAGVGLLAEQVSGFEAFQPVCHEVSDFQGAVGFEAMQDPDSPTGDGQDVAGYEADSSLQVADFLVYAGLAQFTEVMLANGFDDLETLELVDEESLREMGFLKGHIIKFTKRFREFKENPPLAFTPCTPAASQLWDVPMSRPALPPLDEWQPLQQTELWQLAPQAELWQPVQRAELPQPPPVPRPQQPQPQPEPQAPVQPQLQHLQQLQKLQQQLQEQQEQLQQQLQEQQEQLEQQERERQRQRQLQEQQERERQEREQREQRQRQQELLRQQQQQRQLQEQQERERQERERQQEQEQQQLQEEQQQQQRQQERLQEQQQQRQQQEQQQQRPQPQQRQRQQQQPHRSQPQPPVQSQVAKPQPRPQQAQQQSQPRQQDARSPSGLRSDEIVRFGRESDVPQKQSRQTQPQRPQQQTQLQPQTQGRPQAQGRPQPQSQLHQSVRQMVAVPQRQQQAQHVQAFQAPRPQPSMACCRVPRLIQVTPLGPASAFSSIASVHSPPTAAVSPTGSTSSCAPSLGPTSARPAPVVRSVVIPSSHATPPSIVSARPLMTRHTAAAAPSLLTARTVMPGSSATSAASSAAPVATAMRVVATPPAVAVSRATSTSSHSQASPLLPPSGQASFSVRQSWARVQEIGTEVVANALFNNIMKVSPQAVAIFGDEHNEIRPATFSVYLNKVINYLGGTICGDFDYQRLVENLTRIGAMKENTAVTAEHYKLLQHVTDMTLRECLGEVYTTEVRSAWMTSFSFMSSILVDGMQRARGVAAGGGSPGSEHAAAAAGVAAAAAAAVGIAHPGVNGTSRQIGSDEHARAVASDLNGAVS